MRAEAWITDVLNGNAALVGDRVYAYMAPPDAVFPYIVFNFVSGVPLAVVNAIKIWEEMIYQVKAIGKTSSPASLEAIATKIEELLHRKQGTVTNGEVLTSQHEAAVSYPELGDNGVRYHHLGGLYRIRARVT